jgi:hypothetical protein
MRVDEVAGNIWWRMLPDRDLNPRPPRSGGLATS